MQRGGSARFAGYPVKLTRKYGALMTLDISVTQRPDLTSDDRLAEILRGQG